MKELELLEDADRRARDYVASLQDRPAFPPAKAVAALCALDAPFPIEGLSGEAILAKLDEVASPATTASGGGRYFGFVIGGALPAAAAAERLVLAWDQCASSAVNSPAAAAIETAATRLVLEALDLPSQSVIGFGTSATACSLSCLTAARSTLLQRQGWDFGRFGVEGAPPVRVVVPATGHVSIIKALRILGFGTDRIIRAACDEQGRVRPEDLPSLDATTILCLQAGEVNTGSFDRFDEIIPVAQRAGAWVHVDGAFGIWARASKSRSDLTRGIEMADSWTTDGHKWLNVPYDAAMAICRHPEALAAAMNSDASYATADPLAQKNLTLEFSRRLRGASIWAALQHLGKNGLEEMIDRHCRQAMQIADGLRELGLEVLNDVVLNQVLARAADDEKTVGLVEKIQAEGTTWFGHSNWGGRPAFRVSVSSWRIEDSDIDALLKAVARAIG